VHIFLTGCPVERKGGRSEGKKVGKNNWESSLVLFEMILSMRKAKEEGRMRTFTISKIE